MSCIVPYLRYLNLGPWGWIRSQQSTSQMCVHELPRAAVNKMTWWSFGTGQLLASSTYHFEAQRTFDSGFSERIAS